MDRVREGCARAEICGKDHDAPPPPPPLFLMHSPLLASASGRAAVETAALHIQDAYDGRVCIHPREGKWLRRLWLAHLKLHWPVQVALTGLLLLTFVERPAWLAGEDLHSDRAHFYHMFGLPMLPHSVTMPFEAFALLLVAVDGGCAAIAQGSDAILRAKSSRTLAYLLVLSVSIAHLLATAAVLGASRQLPWGVACASPLLRLSLVILQSDTLIGQLELLRRTLPQVVPIFFVLFLFVTAYGWAATLLFQDTPNGAFATLSEAIWHLFIALTSANFPDVCLPAHQSAHAPCLHPIARDARAPSSR